MSYDDNFYTDEPIGIQDDSGNADNGDARWDYVESSETDKTKAWLDDGRLNDNEEDDAPEDIKLLLSIISRDYWSITSNKSFYEQALFMAGYEDDAPLLPFNTYFPTYRQMTAGQLRSYFTIRKMLRQGKHPDVPLSYLFVYAYEILMQIGVSTPDEGYDILCDLRENYPEMNPQKRPYLNEWLRDYVVWYGLNNHFEECFAEEWQKDNACEILNNYSYSSNTELFNALDEYSRHSITKGTLFKKHPDAAVEGVCHIMRRITPVIEKHFGSHLGTLCFGHHSMGQHVMFGTAVFYSPTPIKEADVDVSPLHKYVCRNGLWKVTADSRNITLPPSSLHHILHDIDAMIRQRMGIKPFIRLTSYFNPGGYQGIALQEAADSWFKEWKTREEVRKENERKTEIQKARANVSIDLDKLSSIREDANVVRDKLIVEGDEDESIIPTDKAEHTSSLPSSDKEIAETVSPPSTDVPEKSFIKLLLEGGDYMAFLRSNHTPAGVMMEKINDKAMDVIGDIVLEDDGDKIAVIEDYRDDIEHLYE